MRYILLPEEKISRRLAFYLAVEEVVARRYPGVDAFFAWRVSPTVIVGRNQLIDKEVDYTFCRANGIERQPVGVGRFVFAVQGLAEFAKSPALEVIVLSKFRLDARDGREGDRAPELEPPRAGNDRALPLVVQHLHNNLHGVRLPEPGERVGAVRHGRELGRRAGPRQHLLGVRGGELPAEALEFDVLLGVRGRVWRRRGEEHAV